MLIALLPGAGAIFAGRNVAAVPLRSPFVGTACGGSVAVSFPEFVKKHGRTYEAESEEYRWRAALFTERVLAVESHNCKPNRMWTAAVNHLTDWTEAELASIHGLKQHARAEVGSAPVFRSVRSEKGMAVPESFSWSNLSTIQTPRDQGTCGSCWAFAAETAMRAHAEIRGLPHEFSVSQVVACAPNPGECGGHGGCKGATTELAYEYALQAALAPESSLAYPAGGGQANCPAEMLMSGAPAEASRVSVTADGYEVHQPGDWARGLRRGRDMGMVGWVKLPENREEPLLRALLETGPVSVSVAASYWWHMYWEGVLPPDDCDSGFVIGHAVVLYGIGRAEIPDVGTVNYWHLKNSWGPHWGEKGSMRLMRIDTEEKYCGWDMQPQLGSGCKDGPKKVYVCGSCGILYNAAMPQFKKQ